MWQMLFVFALASRKAMKNLRIGVVAVVSGGPAIKWACVVLPVIVLAAALTLPASRHDFIDIESEAEAAVVAQAEEGLKLSYAEL